MKDLNIIICDYKTLSNKFSNNNIKLTTVESNSFLKRISDIDCNIQSKIINEQNRLKRT